MSYEDFYILEKEISLNLYNKEENKDNINEILNNINGIIEDNIYNENEKKMMRKIMKLIVIIIFVKIIF